MKRMDPVQYLLDLEMIKRLKHRYMRAVDTKEVDELATCFAPDATLEADDGRRSYRGREAIVAFFRELLPQFTSSHVIGQPEIDMTSATTARARWRLDDLVFRDRNILRGAGLYADEYVKLDGNWKIQHTGFIRLFRWTSTVEQLGATLEALPYPDHATPANPAWRPFLTDAAGLGQPPVDEH